MENCKTNPGMYTNLFYLVCWPNGPFLKTGYIFDFGIKTSYDVGQYSLLQTLLMLPCHIIAMQKDIPPYSDAYKSHVKK